MPLSIPAFELEKKIIKNKNFENETGFVVGVDEAGRGPLCGPVVACAATLKEDFSNNAFFESGDWDLIRDSKKLSEKQREKAFKFIYDNFYIGIGLCDHNTIDRINILEASFLAMKKAIQELKRVVDKDIKQKKYDSAFVILVDGNKEIPNLSMEQIAIVSGDSLVKSIAAASIIAKVTRDKMMMEMHEKYPQYGFDKHKGYGTKVHMEALKKHGSCDIHRKTFAPVKRVLLEK